MGKLKEEMEKEYHLSKTLIEEAWKQDSFEKCMAIKEKRDKHWKKYNFLKNLSKALSEKKGGEKK